MAPVYKNFIYNEERGFIFAYVPKVACTNWKSLLRYMAGYEDWLDNRLAHDKVNGGLRYLDLEGPDAALLDDPGIRKYAMVRDPYSRILSAYLNKVEELLPPTPEVPGEDYFRKVVRDIDAFRRDHLDTEAFPEINFEVFLRWLKDGQSWFTKDEHWAPQVDLLRQPGVVFDNIGRFENLSTDSTHLLSAMNCDQRFPSQNAINFAPTHAASKINRYFNKRSQQLCEEIFARDFEAFGYAKRDQEPSMRHKEYMTSQMNFSWLERPSVINTISENDWMWKGNKNTTAYLDAGWSVGRTLLAAHVMIERPPRRILDFGCGHGRVMRWLRAVFPESEIIGSDRVRDGVDFCASTFGAVPVYSNDTYEDIELGGNFDLIWLGSVYTHLPMSLWHKLTGLLKQNLAPNGLLAFSFAGPHVAQLIFEGERNQSAEVADENFQEFLDGYSNSGFGYARHAGVGDREWGRSIISHARIFEFLHQQDLSILLLGERLYDRRQDIVIAQQRKP